MTEEEKEERDLPSVDGWHIGWSIVGLALIVSPFNNLLIGLLSAIVAFFGAISFTYLFIQLDGRIFQIQSKTTDIYWLFFIPLIFLMRFFSDSSGSGEVVIRIPEVAGGGIEPIIAGVSVLGALASIAGLALQFFGGD
ncbi:hypothetical protein [Halobacterium sp. CBA1126]|uniref:hypothetical protein n=1 Tax=Halobacterium sp. CBA1126 TaxID=2668074 RepID=UPI0012FC5370|nr:hypothetical protein [Halobacterium sp. CBA1126]MUV61930.1 hypothetical protein [Halobacterium sp. CBA1126]